MNRASADVERGTDAGLLGASPFDLPISQTDIPLRFARPPDRPHWPIDLTRAFVARLWRSGCAAGHGAASCVERGPGRRCEQPLACAAHRLVPMDDKAGSEQVCRLALAALPGGAGAAAGQAVLRLRLVGASVAGQTAPVLALLQSLLQGDGLREAAGANLALFMGASASAFTVAQRAAQLAQHRRWRLVLLAPWVVQHGGQPLDLGWLLSDLWAPKGPILRRVFKLVASDLAERAHHASGGPTGSPTGEPTDAGVDSPAPGQWALQARQLMSDSLPAVRTDAVHLSTHTHREAEDRFHRQCVQGSLCFSVSSAAAALDLAALLAIAEVMGLGRETAKGYGAVQVFGL